MIPLSIAIFMLGLFLLQWNNFQMQQKNIILKNELQIHEELEILKKEFKEYKKRVDTLTLKAGFKLWKDLIGSIVSH